MGSSEQYIDERLDRLAGAIRDEAAGRREDYFDLRLNLENQITNLRREMTKEDDSILRLLFAVAVGVVILLSVCAPKADAAPLVSSPSAHHYAPASVTLMRFRTDRRFDDLNRKIDVGSNRTAEDLRHLRSHIKEGLEELDHDSRVRSVLLFFVAIGLALWLFFGALLLKF
jgi:hypothetical protein